MELTRQQKRAMARQKHNTQIQEGGYYRLKADIKSKVQHPILRKDMFALIKVLGVTQYEVTYISPYRSKGRSYVVNFFDQFEAVNMEDIKDTWIEMEAEALSIRGQKVTPQQLYEKFNIALEEDPLLSEAMKS